MASKVYTGDNTDQRFIPSSHLHSLCLKYVLISLIDTLLRIGFMLT